MKRIVILIAFIIIWFLFFGIRLIGYFSSVADIGLRKTMCGTQGCSDFIFILSTIWTFALFIFIPLVVAILILKKKKV